MIFFSCLRSPFRGTFPHQREESYQSLTPGSVMLPRTLPVLDSFTFRAVNQAQKWIWNRSASSPPREAAFVSSKGHSSRKVTGREGNLCSDCWEEAGSAPEPGSSGSGAEQQLWTLTRKQSWEAERPQQARRTSDLPHIFARWQASPRR